LALRLEAIFPAALFGPVLRLAFSRSALICFSLAMTIQRYRLLRHKVLAAFRPKAIEVGIAPEFEDEAEGYIVQNALSWQMDPIAAAEIESRLADYGIDRYAISMEFTSTRARFHSLRSTIERCTIETGGHLGRNKQFWSTHQCTKETVAVAPLRFIFRQKHLYVRLL